MKKKVIIGLLGVIVSGLLIWQSHATAYQESIDKVTPKPRLAQIRPDYHGTVIPPNIAPLNFTIQEVGEGYCVRFSSGASSPWELFSRSAQISIPLSTWKTFLNEHQGQEIQVEVLVKQSDQTWTSFEPWPFTIATDPIDEYVVYRRMHPTHLRVNGEIGIYYRDLTGFKESTLLSGMSVKNGCLNCHSFAGNRADTMLLGVRSESYGVGTLWVHGQEVTELGTKFGYTSWHPSGKLAVYSCNKLPMFFHACQQEPRDTINMDSWLGIYYPGSQTIQTEPRLSAKDRLENWPAWSGDGKQLFYCSAPKLWPDNAPHPPKEYNQVKYDLMAIDYDPDTNSWGQTHTLISAQETGKTVGMPHCSPDGRWLVVCLFDYGYFPSWKQESDLYLIDLEAYRRTGECSPRRLAINSEFSESWQSWSSNSRWLVFSSKRMHGPLTRLFVSYVDESGQVHPPFVLPQANPDYYEHCLEAFNTPELITSAPPFTREALARVYRSPNAQAMTLPVTMASPQAEQESTAWQSTGNRE